MHIAVNLRTFFQGEIGGLENVVRHIVGGIAADQYSKRNPVTIFVHDTQARYVRLFAPHAHVISLADRTAEQTIEHELETGKYLLLFCPLLVLEPLAPKVPSVVCMPDLQHEVHPEFFTEDVLQWRRRSYRPSARNADAIVTISEHAKRTIIQKFGVKPSKVEVVYLDVDEEFRNESELDAVEAFRSLSLPKRYLYYPANFWPHKNHTNLLRAMPILAEVCPDLRLVLTGAQSTGVERVSKEIQNLGLEDRVRLLPYQLRSLVAEIYRHAQALVFVSKFEGFGIPLLEAFHTGTPVVASRSTSCPEIAGRAALLVDPDEPRDIAAAVRRVVDDPALCQNLVNAGKVRTESFSWERSVNQVLRLIDSVATRPTLPQRIEIQENPVVSIVTPSHNHARFLEKTIESVLTQDYPHIDYIVMDGDSTDGTPEILRKYASRLRYRSQADAGQADAINQGISMSSGPICAYLNADDTYLPGAVGRAVRYMLQSPAMAVVYGEGYYVDEQGDIIDRYPTYPFDPVFLTKNCYICQPSAFIRRSVFDEVGRLNPEQDYALDYDLWLRIAKRYPMLKVDDYLATSRMYGDNKTMANRRNVYMETISAVQHHHHYAPFDWVFGYASHLVNRKASFFAPPPPSRTQFALALLLGAYYNRRCFRRYFREWRAAYGLPWTFTGRWHDGWISKRYITDSRVVFNASQIVIKGKYPEFLPRDLTLGVWLNGRKLGWTRLGSYGDFTVRFDCPTSERGKEGCLEIRCNQTVRPRNGGDHRELGCLIDSVRFAES